MERLLNPGYSNRVYNSQTYDLEVNRTEFFNPIKDQKLDFSYEIKNFEGYIQIKVNIEYKITPDKWETITKSFKSNIDYKLIKICEIDSEDVYFMITDSIQDINNQLSGFSIPLKTTPYPIPCPDKNDPSLKLKELVNDLNE